jgi:AbiV family abortive infection protein
MEPAVQPPDNRAAAMQACVEHAKALLKSARAVIASGHPNIAFHLAVLALEELGRRELIGVQSIIDTRPVPPGWAQKHTQDHVKKLFWCFFGGSFFAARLTKEHLESLEDFAQRLHAKRLAGLYVDQTEDTLSIPSEAIDSEEATRIIELAGTRYEMSANEKLRDHIPPDELELQTWFLAATDDPEKQRWILSRGSLAKLAELGDAKLWVLSGASHAGSQWTLLHFSARPTRYAHACDMNASLAGLKL